MYFISWTWVPWKQNHLFCLLFVYYSLILDTSVYSTSAKLKFSPSRSLVTLSHCKLVSGLISLSYSVTCDPLLKGVYSFTFHIPGSFSLYKPHKVLVVRPTRVTFSYSSVFSTSVNLTSPLVFRKLSILIPPLKNKLKIVRLRSLNVLDYYKNLLVSPMMSLYLVTTFPSFSL